MELTQIYETMVAEPGLGLSFSVIVVPARSFPEGHTPDRDDLASSLDLDWQVGLENVAELPSAIIAILHGEISQGSRAGDPGFEFAEAVAFGDIVPFESSPLDARSLASIVTGSGVAAGAAVGFVVGAGVPPLLLITVPAGMIICGAAAGIAAALDQGLKARLLRRLGVEQGQATGAAR